MPKTLPATPFNIGAKRSRRGLLFFFALCLLVCPATAGPALAAGFTLVAGAPSNDQLSLFATHIAGGLNPGPIVRFTPGLSGAYALRDTAGDPRAVAAFALPAYFLMGSDPRSPFSEGDLEPLLLAARVPAALWVPQDSPIAGLADFIALARREKDALVCAGPGRFTAPHLASVIFNRESGALTLFLPLVGTEEARKAALQGRVKAVWAYALAAETMPGFRPLAVAAETRSPALPDTPTFAELRLGVTAWAELGFAVSPKIKNKAEILADLRTARDNPETLAVLARLGFTPRPLEGEDLAGYLKQRADALKRFKEEYPRLMD